MSKHCASCSSIFFDEQYLFSFCRFTIAYANNLTFCNSKGWWSYCSRVPATKMLCHGPTLAGK
uniref:Uncharacterized protein n=1 Tax=Triticum urartu TaxID=4572 RepID=A0A8R7QVQ9_TRIUA